MSALGGRFEGLRVVDLFAGSGALGLETLSRGAEAVVFVEISRGALKALHANIDTLDARDRCTVLRADVHRWIAGVEGVAFDLALADPPYGQGHAAALLEAFRRAPFADELWLEHRTGETIPELPGMRQRRYGDTTLTALKREDLHP
jgi:16S rRNA (guanine966-N2)-methyltransferase